jgi:hypothetical protein
MPIACRQRESDDRWGGWQVGLVRQVGGASATSITLLMNGNPAAKQ